MTTETNAVVVPLRHATRAERMRMPLARDVVEAVAVEYGVCVRPVAVRRTDMNTGESVVVDVPCGSTMASVCRPCAVRKKQLRMAQCREGWHLETEPVFEADEPNGEQRELAALRADLTAGRDVAVSVGEETGEWDEAIREIDAALADSGVRGSVDPAARARRVRSTRRRQDAPDLPKRKVEKTTLGRIYSASGGKVFRPSVFLTLTCDTYGRVRQDGTPVDPDTYDYRRAARDAIHFGKVVDRFIQNLRRVAGYDVQYFATVEPQRRLAPHLHLAMRGTVSRAELRMIAAATYHQVWWPSSDVVAYEGDRLPVWDEGAAAYVDGETGAILPTWDEALDAIGPDDEPTHVVRFGPQLHAEGVIAGSPDAKRCIGYLTKYLTKSIDQCHEPETAAQQAHVDRLCEALRYEPCSPTCANWLRYGVQPSNARPGLKPGHCRGKAHRRQHLGYGGRRVLVSRKWSGKTLADHKHERRAYVLATLGVDTGETELIGAKRYAWQLARPTDPDVAPLAHRLLRAVAERQRWREQYERARALVVEQLDEISATTGRAA
jgi:hypothetical protein